MQCNAGAVISYAYGWVDIATPSGIPLQVIVGECRDPLMLASLQVSNMADSVDFFTRKLGMKTLLFPLARQKGSAFEPTPPKDSIFMGYGADTMGLLLVPFSKNKASPVLDVGNVLRGFKIVVDTSRVENLPPYVAEQCSSKMISENGVQREVLSPDGYRFTLQPYKEFALEASTA